MLSPRQNQKKVFVVETSPQAFGFDACSGYLSHSAALSKVSTHISSKNGSCI